MRALLFLLLVSGYAHASPRTVMLQLFGWPWSAVGEECERVLGPAGYAAVQVSPPQEHIVVNGAPWWERYQPVSYKLESRSGNEAEFAAMVRKCKQAGVEIYADVVLNHMNAMPAGAGFGGTRFSHYSYEGTWSEGDFHYCGRNSMNFTDLFELQNCELLGMADLHTGKPSVQVKLAAYLDHLLDLGVGGFRVDAAKHVSAADLQAIFGLVRRSHYRVLELILSPGEPVRLEDYLPAGDINDFAYAYAVGDAFLSGDFSRLPVIPGASGIHSEDSVVFVENHDLERRPPSENLASFVKDPVLHKLASVFLLTWPYGYPAVYSGYNFREFDAGPPLDGSGRIRSPLSGGGCLAPFTCVHRLPWMQRLVAFRNATDGTFRATDVRAERNMISFGRGSAGHVVISLGGGELSVQTRLAPGRYCNQVMEDPDSECATVGSDGKLKLRLAPRSAFVAVPAFR
jgi:alpha-amylase